LFITVITKYLSFSVTLQATEREETYEDMQNLKGELLTDPCPVIVPTDVTQLKWAIYGMRNWERQKVEIFSSPRRPDRLWGPIQWVPGVKRPGRETDHSLPTSAEVKNTWIYTSTPPYVFVA
jgi:hypothetical protein